MLVPQARERAFFIARRNDLKLSDLKLSFDYPIINVATALEGFDYRVPAPNMGAKYYQTWNATLPGKSLAHANKRLFGSDALFNHLKIDPDSPAPTLLAKNCNFHWSIPRVLRSFEYSRLCSFPDDYDASESHKVYACGMSVPPRMMQCISSEIYKQWFA
jgi:DNA (cytosine-5)-methyltransferase 1